MVKKLSQVGSSLALIIDKPILELFKIDKETPLEITPEPDGFKIKILRPEDRDRLLKEAMKDADQKFGKMFKNLAK